MCSKCITLTKQQQKLSHQKATKQKSVGKPVMIISARSSQVTPEETRESKGNSETCGEHEAPQTITSLRFCQDRTTIADPISLNQEVKISSCWNFILSCQNVKVCSWCAKKSSSSSLVHAWNSPGKHSVFIFHLFAVFLHARIGPGRSDSVWVFVLIFSPVIGIFVRVQLSVCRPGARECVRRRVCAERPPHNGSRAPTLRWPSALMKWKWDCLFRSGSKMANWVWQCVEVTWSTLRPRHGHATPPSTDQLVHLLSTINICFNEDYNEVKTYRRLAGRWNRCS